jgi:hypothetical protein
LHPKLFERIYDEPQEIRLKLLLGRPAGSMIECWYVEDSEKGTVERYALAGRPLYM